MVPAAFAPTDPPSCGGDQVDEVVVGVGDRWPLDLGSVAHVEPHPLRTGDVDVADVGVVEERLEPGDPVEITAGPLAGLSGIVVRAASGRRFVVRVDFIQKGASILLEAGDLVPLQRDSQLA